MAKKRAIKNPELKKKQPKNLGLDEVKYIIDNAQSKTLEEIAEHLNCDESQVQEVVSQYNKAGNNLARGAFARKDGAVVMTEASSSMGDRVMGNTPGNLRIKPVDKYIFRMENDS